MTKEEFLEKAKKRGCDRWLETIWFLYFHLMSENKKEEAEAFLEKELLPSTGECILDVTPIFAEI